MSDQQPQTITVPSELERGDGFVDLAALKQPQEMESPRRGRVICCFAERS